MTDPNEQLAYDMGDPGRYLQPHELDDEEEPRMEHRSFVRFWWGVTVGRALFWLTVGYLVLRKVMP